MTAEQAKELIHERTAAAAGVQRTPGRARAVQMAEGPDVLLRRLFAGDVPLEELEAVLEHCGGAAENVALGMLGRIMASLSIEEIDGVQVIVMHEDTPGGVARELMGVFGQHVLYGLALGRDA